MDNKNKKREFTVTSVILGILMSIIFGGANAYLGLRVGMTVSASIPAAVISMGVLRLILRRDSILENNMVQTIASAGESVAAGSIFTLPALFLWAAEGKSDNPSLIEIMIIALIGGILGVLFMVPLRKLLIVKEKDTLPYPEGSACAEVLEAGESGGKKAGIVFGGVFVAGLYKYITEGLKWFGSEIHFEIKRLGGAFGVDVLPALIGVGYICGTNIASFMFAGGIFGWLILMPLIKMFGGAEVAALDSFGVWSSYIKYIGAGCVAAGGIISLIKSVPMMYRSFFGLTKGSEVEDEPGKKDLPKKFIIVGIVILALAIWLLPFIPVTLLGTVLIIIFGFIFATVSSKLVGMVGSSNNPVSGMTIATLIIVSIIIKWSGSSDIQAMISVVAIGSIICMVAAVAGDTSQDLKTGYLVGATPRKQQIGEIIGVIASSLTIGAVLYILNQAWGFGSESLPAPQATLMKIIVEGVMQESMPWVLIFVGVFIAVALELMRVPILPFAVGLYLPIHLSAGIMLGGVARFITDKLKYKETNGVLLSSGLIAGEGLMGIILAIVAIF